MRAYLATSLADGQGSGILEKLTTELFFGGIALLAIAAVIRQINRRLENRSSKASLVGYGCIVLGLFSVYLALFG
jgi:hypothetical protein